MLIIRNAPRFEVYRRSSSEEWEYSDVREGVVKLATVRRSISRDSTKNFRADPRVVYCSAAVTPASDAARFAPTAMAIVLVKRSDRIYALTETCPHLGGPLSEGKLVGDAIQCPWHMSELALEDGHVVNGPTTFTARCFDVRCGTGRSRFGRRRSMRRCKIPCDG